jgi:hypothetical protein
MEQRDSKQSGRPAAASAREDRLAREAAALRANLRKRKEQARARDEEPSAPVDEPRPDLAER